MPTLDESTDRLRILGQLVAELNRAADVRGALVGILKQLVADMDLLAGWILLADPGVDAPRAGPGFILAAHHGLPAAIAADHPTAWQEACPCEERLREQSSTHAWNEPECPRLAPLRDVIGAETVHASAALQAHGRFLGLLNVARADWRPLDERSLALLAQAGREIGAAILRARAYERLMARRAEEQSALLDLSRELLAHRSVDELIQSVLRSARDVLHADACCLVLPAGSDGFLEFRGAVGWRRNPASAGRRVRTDRRCSAWLAMRTQRPVLASDLRISTIGTWFSSWARSEGFRGHMAVPLVVESKSIGALILNTRTPRTFYEDGTRFLQLLADQAALALESAALREREAGRERLQSELRLARDIQRLMMPQPHLENVLGWDLASTYHAAEAVGGDFYDVLRDYGRPGRIGLLIGDVSGKSVSGALLMAVSLSVIREAARRTSDPAETLRDANTRLRALSQDDRFVCAFFGWLDTRSGFLSYACAGQDPPLLHRAGAATAQELTAPGVVLGILDEPVLQTCHVHVHPGDAIVLYTDGVTEARDTDDNLFGERRLEAAVVRSPDGPAQVILDRIVSDVNVFTGNAPRSDDVTVLVAHRLTRPI